MAFRKRDIYGGVEQWRLGDRGATNNWPGTFAKDNAGVNGSGTVTAYGRVVAGTVCAIGPDGKLHPCGLAEIEAPVVAANALEIHAQAAANFYIGDEVAMVNIATARSFAITGAESTDVITTASVHDLIVGDQVTISGLTGGAGAVAGTYVVATVPSDTTLTLTGFAFTTNITVGTLTKQLPEPAYTNITGTRHVATVDKTSGAVTLDGAAFTAAAGDLLVKVNAYRPQGILADHVVTQTIEYGVPETADKLVSVALEGDGRMRQCPGITPTSSYEAASKLMEMLKGAPYADPMTGARVTPKFAELTFRDV